MTFSECSPNRCYYTILSQKFVLEWLIYANSDQDNAFAVIVLFGSVEICHETFYFLFFLWSLREGSFYANTAKQQMVSFILSYLLTRRLSYTCIISVQQFPSQTQKLLNREDVDDLALFTQIFRTITLLWKYSVISPNRCHHSPSKSYYGIIQI